MKGGIGDLWHSRGALPCMQMDRLNKSRWDVGGQAAFPVVVVAVVVAVVCVGHAALAVDCGYTPYHGFDLSGGDLPNQPVANNLSTPEQCAALCCATGFPCAAFALNAATGPGRR